MRLGEATSTSLDAPRFAAEFKSCRASFESQKPPNDLALRRRLSRLLEQLGRAVVPETLVAAWDDLLSALPETDNAQRAARHLLTIASWIGHPPDILRQRIERELLGHDSLRIDDKVVHRDTEDRRSAAERVNAVRSELAQPAARGRAIVWLRFQLAKVDWEPGGFPVIRIGDAVTIYQGDWLRACVLHRQPDRGLPPEVIDPDRWELRLFLGLPAYGTEPEVESDPPEHPRAYIRIDVAEQMLARAVDIARANAEAVAALGTLYGADPTLWNLDESNIVFIDGYQPGSVTAPVEKRRSRTRNALMHGGPLAPGTVTSVAEFADNLASEALAACIEGMLLGQDSIDYFLDRRSRAADMRARLSRGDAPPAVLFAEAPT